MKESEGGNQTLERMDDDEKEKETLKNVENVG